MTAWLDIAKQEFGVNEQTGKKRIHQYFVDLGLESFWNENIGNKIPDWCAVFANWCLCKKLYEGTDSVAAISFLKFGIRLEEPKEGCIVVLARFNPLDWRSHVGFFLDMDKVRIKLHGGNQGNKVGQNWYLKARVRKDGYRWPAELNIKNHLEVRDAMRGRLNEIIRNP
jgi:uncharacterized protein (TIGR02594 family)